MLDVEPKDFTDPEIVYQIGVEPNRIDILMYVEGVDFEDAYKRKVKSFYGGVPIFIMGIDDLIKAKEASGRLQDKIDLKKLRSFRDEENFNGSSGRKGL